MFRRNDDHQRPSLFNTVTELPNTVRQRLEDSWASGFYEHVFCQINEDAFAVLYADNVGRPNFPVNILLSLEIMAALFNYTVAEMLDQYYFNVQVRWALGIRDIAERAVAERTIFEFRQRLYLHAMEYPGRDNLIYQQFQLITDHLLKVLDLDRSEARMDSTQIMSNIRRAGRLSLAYDVLKQAARACPADLLPEELQEVLRPEFKNQLLLKVKAREVEGRLSEMLQLSAQLVQLTEEHRELQQLDAVQLLARFLMEQGDYDAATQTWTPKALGASPTSHNLHSAYDADATLRKKGDNIYVGYVANLTETCADGNPVQLILDYMFEQNTAADTTMAQDALPHLADQHGVEDLYVDGGYSGESVYDEAKAHAINLHFTNMTGKESQKIPLHEFRFDGHTVTHCPAGQPSTLSIYNEMTGRILVHFDKEICNNCPARHACPSQPKKQAQTLSISHKQRIAAETRKQIQDPKQHRINTSKRAAIEGTNSEMKRTHGAEKLRVRGVHKCRTLFGFIAIARNVKQALRCFRGDKRRSLQDAERQQRRGLVPVPTVA